jgi:single-stranded-DNA-specific exonuclease
VATLSELTLEAVRGLEAFQPCGRGNPEPIFLVEGLTVAERARAMGAGAKHLSVQLTDGRSRRRCVAWGMGEHAEKLGGGVRVKALMKARLNRYQGVESVEPEIADLAIERG